MCEVYVEGDYSGCTPNAVIVTRAEMTCGDEKVARPKDVKDDNLVEISNCGIVVRDAMHVAQHEGMNITGQRIFELRSWQGGLRDGCGCQDVGRFDPSLFMRDQGLEGCEGVIRIWALVPFPGEDNPTRHTPFMFEVALSKDGRLSAP